MNKKSFADPARNMLLAALPSDAFRRLKPELEPVTLEVGQTLFHSAGRLAHAYFPTRGIVSLSYAVDGRRAMAKAWPVGREGIVGISVLLGAQYRANRADIRFGGDALRVRSAALLAEFRRGQEFQRLILRYVFALLTQASQLSVCSSHHSVDQRVCRFLDRVFDRLETDCIEVTQQHIAAMLSVRRVSVTNALALLQDEKIVECTYGGLRLISRRKLRAHACGCATIIRRAFASVAESKAAGRNPLQADLLAMNRSASARAGGYRIKDRRHTA